VDYQTV